MFYTPFVPDTGFVDDVNGWDFGGNCSSGAWRPAPAPPPPPPVASAYPPPSSSSSPPPIKNITIPRPYSGVVPATSALELRSLASCTGDGNVSPEAVSNFSMPRLGVSHKPGVDSHVG